MSTTIRMNTKQPKNSKTGPRIYHKGDSEQFGAGYDKIWSKPPVCQVCSSKSKSGTCPSCD